MIGGMPRPIEEGDILQVGHTDIEVVRALRQADNTHTVSLCGVAGACAGQGHRIRGSLPRDEPLSSEVNQKQSAPRVQLVTARSARSGSDGVMGALMVPCVARGAHLFGTGEHDQDTVRFFLENDSADSAEVSTSAQPMPTSSASLVDHDDGRAGCRLQASLAMARLAPSVHTQWCMPTLQRRPYSGRDREKWRNR